MRKIPMTCLLFLVACAHAPAEPPALRDQLMARCASACEPGEAVQAMMTADRANDLWICVCRPGDATAANGI